MIPENRRIPILSESRYLAEDKIDGRQSAIGIRNQGIFGADIGGDAVPATPGEVAQHNEIRGRRQPRPALIRHPFVQNALLGVAAEDEWLAKSEESSLGANLVEFEPRMETVLEPMETHQRFGKRPRPETPAPLRILIHHPAKTRFPGWAKQFGPNSLTTCWELSA